MEIVSQTVRKQKVFVLADGPKNLAADLCVTDFTESGRMFGWIVWKWTVDGEELPEAD